MEEFYDKVEEVFLLCMNINKETKHHVFVEYAPHIKALSVRVFDGGWESDKDSSFRKDALGAQDVSELNYVLLNLREYI